LDCGWGEDGNVLLLLGWNNRECTICVISEHTKPGPLAHNIVEVPQRNGVAFLLRIGDALLIDLRDPHNPCCLHRTNLNILPNPVDEQNFVEESCRVHDVDDEGIFNVAACALLELRDYDPMCIDGENGNVVSGHFPQFTAYPLHLKVLKRIPHIN
jgi:splicing factor 3B subunit 3